MQKGFQRDSQGDFTPSAPIRIFTDRVILIPGPAEEVEIIRDIYRLYTEELFSSAVIAQKLNERDLPTEFGGPWTRHIVREILTNPKYIGANVTNRHSCKLRGRSVRNPPEMWVRRENAFAPLVTVETFQKAHEITARRTKRYTDAELLDSLRLLQERTGRLSIRLINDSSDMPCLTMYQQRFGGVTEAYRRIGYQCPEISASADVSKRIRARRREYAKMLIQELRSTGACVELGPRPGLVTVNGEFTILFTVARCLDGDERTRWKLRLSSRLKPDITVVGRMDPRERNHQKYKQIAASLASVGLIEPLIVFPRGRGVYEVLDGVKRLDILSKRKEVEVKCIIATDDESYNYNWRVNYLSTVGEYQMILRALQHNSEETIAEALNVEVSTIRKKRGLLTGICKEVVDILKDKRVPPKSFAALRKMKPIRQIQAAELMVASDAYTGAFAAALLAGSKDEMLLEVPKNGRRAEMLPTERARFIAETESLLQHAREVEASYGTEALTLSVCCRYLEKLLESAKVSQYLTKKHPEILDELRGLVKSFRDGLCHTVAQAAS
jgi:hypothetical protein